jgi:competence protein ComEC
MPARDDAQPEQARRTWSPAPAALCVGAGVGGFFVVPGMPPVWLMMAAFAAATLLLAVVRRALGPRWRAAALGLWLVAAGAGLAYLDACAVVCEPFPEDLVNRTLVVEGRIVSLPESLAYASRFLFQIEQATLDDAPLPGRWRARLSWYRGAPPLAAGQRWLLPVRLKPPHGFLNPGGFDYERWLFEQGVAATGHVTGADAARLLDPGPGGQWLNRWRQGLRDRLDTLLPPGPASALVKALVIGDRGGIEPEQWEVFARTGTSHLIAISGLHVGLVAGVVFGGVRFAWARMAWLAWRFAAPRAAAVAALLAAGAYAGLAGFSISTQRALVMLCVVLIAVISGRTLRPLSGLSLALLAVLLLDPSSLLSFGFWLSFGAVGVLLYALAQRLGTPMAPLRWGRAQWAVAIGLLPMLLLFFGRASVVAPAVNLLLVPLFGLLLPLVLLATALALVGDWAWALVPVTLVLNAGYGALADIAALPLAGIGLGGRAAWVWFAAAGGVLLLLAPRGVPARWLGLVLLLPLALARAPAPEPGEAKLTMLDVGQGLAVVIRTAGHTLVYDTGPRFPSGFNTGSAVIAPFLRHGDVTAVDLAVVSHADQDHAGGLAGLSEAIPLRRVMSGEEDELSWLAGDEPAPWPAVEPCRAGMNWTWDGVHFRVLHPRASPVEEGNDASCVLHVASGGASVLLTGDIEAGVEAELVAADAAVLSADVLMAPHHGSDSSSTEAFLRAVAPDWVWFSAGYANRFAFPNGPVLERVNALGIATANTASDGAVSLRLPAEPGPLVPTRYRPRAARVWRHRPER